MGMQEHIRQRCTYMGGSPQTAEFPENSHLAQLFELIQWLSKQATYLFSRLPLPPGKSLWEIPIMLSYTVHGCAADYNTKWDEYFSGQATPPIYSTVCMYRDAFLMTDQEITCKKLCSNTSFSSHSNKFTVSLMTYHPFVKLITSFWEDHFKEGLLEFLEKASALSRKFPQISSRNRDACDPIKLNSENGVNQLGSISSRHDRLRNSSKFGCFVVIL